MDNDLSWIEQGVREDIAACLDPKAVAQRSGERIQKALAGIAQSPAKNELAYKMAVAENKLTWLTIVPYRTRWNAGGSNLKPNPADPYFVAFERRKAAELAAKQEQARLAAEARERRQYGGW